MGAKLTKEGYEKLKNELVYLQTTRRKEVVQQSPLQGHSD